MGNSEFIGQCQGITDGNMLEEVLVIAAKAYEDMNNKNKDSIILLLKKMILNIAIIKL